MNRFALCNKQRVTPLKSKLNVHFDDLIYRLIELIEICLHTAVQLKNLKDLLSLSPLIIINNILSGVLAVIAFYLTFYVAFFFITSYCMV